jgi:hypothetical protein
LYVVIAELNTEIDCLYTKVTMTLRALRNHNDEPYSRVHAWMGATAEQGATLELLAAQGKMTVSVSTLIFHNY